MDLNALKMIVSVARHRSLAGAARHLDCDPSTVSRTVSTVEAELGIRLFERTTRALSVTEAGQTYLQRITPLIEELEAARDEARRLRHTPSGTLRMTCSVAFALHCIVPHLRAFKAAYPEIAIELLPTDENVDLLSEHIDLAIRLAPAPAGNLISTKLMPTRYRVVAAPDFVVEHGPFTSPSQLSQTECLRFALPGYRHLWKFRDQDQRMEEVEVGGQVMIANASALRQAALSGMGAALLADWLIGEDVKAGALVDLFPAYDVSATSFDTAAWLLYPSRSYLPRKVRVMIDFLKQRFSRNQVR